MLEVGGAMYEYQALMKEDSNESSADILIIEDEEPIARLMVLHLRAAGYTTHCCYDGDAALKALADGKWRLVILDRMLPGVGGMQLLRWLKKNERRMQLPVLMVTALGMASERVQGLNEGADDYLPKPFEPEELVARVRALLRRARVQESPEAGAPTLWLDPEVPVIHDGDRTVEVRPLEYRLMQVLMEKPGKTRSRDYLLDHVWGRDVFVEARTVDVTVKRLRKALDTIGRKDCIETVRSMGYRFVAPDA